MKLHAVYRATGKRNRKPRPPGFSKRHCLESFLRAWQMCPRRGELVFVVDGELPGELSDVIAATGTVVSGAGLEVHGSYWTAVRLTCGAAWSDDDLVYFAEDDYVFRLGAFNALVEAADALPATDYFALYAAIGSEMPNGEDLTPGLRRPRLRGERLAQAGGADWRRATSHTSSFAVRLAALRADRTVHLLAPRCSAAWDHALCLSLQRRLPYGPLELLRALHEPSGATSGRRVRIVLWRLALTLEALGRRHRRTIAAPRPPLATHMELGQMAFGTDWTAL